MKSVCLLSFTCAVLTVTGCVEFPASYSRIESEQARLIDFIYEPAEAAPGDTVLLRAIFAGRPVTSDELTWEMSSKVIINQYGTATAVDTVPLAIKPQPCTFSDRTSCIAFTFVVPEDIIAESPLIPDNWTTVIPDYYRNELPPAVLDLSKSELLALVENLSTSKNISSLSINQDMKELLPMLLQSFTAQMRIYCTIANDHTILSRYSVRYNSRFASIPDLFIPVNRNPRIDSVGVYIVHKTPLSSFDPADRTYEFEYLPVRDTGRTTIPVNDGYSYFFSTIIGAIDSTLSIDAAMGNGKPLSEQFQLQWYMEFDPDEQKDVATTDILDISDRQRVTVRPGRFISQLYPSRNSAITNCTVWLEVSDRFLNEFYRPIGSTVKEMRFGFTY